jgi:hypothetical protein
MEKLESQFGYIIPYDKNVEELVELTKEEAPLCWTAYIALSKNNSNNIAIVFEQLLDNKDWAHVRSTIEAIGKNKNGLLLESKLINFLNSKNSFIVNATIKALSNLKSTIAHEKIKSLINNDTIEIKQAAIEGISNIWQLKDFNFLIELDKNSTNEDIRKAIGYVLAEHIDNNNWKIFFEHYHKDEIVRHREWALIFANEYSNDKKLINLFLNDKDGHIRKKANQFL